MCLLSSKCLFMKCKKKKINSDDLNIYEIIFLHYSHRDQKNSEICIFCLLDGVACSGLCSGTDVDNESCVW